jgi:hypothetical protein
MVESQLKGYMWNTPCRVKSVGTVSYIDVDHRCTTSERSGSFPVDVSGCLQSEFRVPA